MLGFDGLPSPQPERPTGPIPELVAHRGWTSRFPENTLAAIRGALEAGTRFVEVDVQLSADERPVLFHDRTLDRLCGIQGPVHDRTASELAAFACSDRGRFGERFASERIAGLSNFVELLIGFGDVFAFIEIKRVAIETFGTAVVLDRVLPLLEPVRERVALISFSTPCLAEARQRTSIPIGTIHDTFAERDRSAVRELAPEFMFFDADGLPSTGPIDTERIRVASDDAIRSPTQTGPSIRHSTTALDREAAATRIAVYEIAEPSVALALAARGVDFVETFAIGEMLGALGPTVGHTP
jgi:glycerophosphoryl diester phosphodiesterase